MEKLLYAAHRKTEIRLYLTSLTAFHSNPPTTPVNQLTLSEAKQAAKEEGKTLFFRYKNKLREIK